MEEIKIERNMAMNRKFKNFTEASCYSNQTGAPPAEISSLQEQNSIILYVPCLAHSPAMEGAFVALTHSLEFCYCLWCGYTSICTAHVPA